MQDGGAPARMGGYGTPRPPLHGPGGGAPHPCAGPSIMALSGKTRTAGAARPPPAFARPAPVHSRSRPLPTPAVTSTAPPRQARHPAFSAPEFRSALGMFATGVTIVTLRSAAGELVGLTANSFNSVSLSPPLVLWSLGQAASSMPAMAAGTHYAVHVLAADQKALAERFAGPRAERWTGVAFRDGVSGAPVLEGAAAVFECFNRSRYPEGDHTIFVGEVEACSHRAGASPLLYHGGRFHTEHPL